MICRNDLRKNIFVNFENNSCTITEVIAMMKNWYLTTWYLQKMMILHRGINGKKGGTDELIKVSDRKVRSATLCVCNKDG